MFSSAYAKNPAAKNPSGQNPGGAWKTAWIFNRKAPAAKTGAVFLCDQ